MRKTRISITATTSPGTSSDPTPVRTSWMAGESANFSWVAKKKGWKNHPCLPLNDVAWCKLHRWTSVVAPHPILVVQVDPTRRSGSFVGKRPPRFGRRILRPVGHTPATNHKITQWRKAKQMQTAWLCILTGRQFEDSFENIQRPKDHTCDRAVTLVTRDFHISSCRCLWYLWKSGLCETGLSRCLCH